MSNKIVKRKERFEPGQCNRLQIKLLSCAITDKPSLENENHSYFADTKRNEKIE